MRVYKYKIFSAVLGCYCGFVFAVKYNHGHRANQSEAGSDQFRDHETLKKRSTVNTCNSKINMPGVNFCFLANTINTKRVVFSYLTLCANPTESCQS